VLHLHRLLGDLRTLRERFAGFLDRIQGGSEALPRYIGLSDPDRLYHHALNPLPRAPI
jgi:hypothetical protein